MATKITQALIYQELQTIKHTIEEHTTQDNDNFRELRRLFEGTDTAPGMKVRVDRLEQSEESRDKQRNLMWTAIASLAVGLLSKFWNG